MHPDVVELRNQWRPLSSATIGLACGLVMNSYVVGIMAPHLLAEFAWSKSEFALLGAFGLLAMLVYPFVGRLTDVIGVRRTALIGVVASPLIFLAFSRIHDLRTYAILFALQCMILTTTTPPVYCRIVVQYIKRARGLALALAAAGPPATLAIAGPLLNNFVTEHGWRAGYIALAIFAAAVGSVALLLMPPERREEPVQAKPKTAKEDYRRIFRTRAFWVLIAAMLFCNLPHSVMVTQLNLALVENGVNGKSISAMISGFATGVIVGRFASGIALDRLPAHWVATISLGMSAIGLLGLASPFDHVAVLFVSVSLMGLAHGAESDIVAFLVARLFGVRIYSSVYSIMSATIALSGAIGAGLLSGMIALTGTFAPYLAVTGFIVLGGSMLFMFLPRTSEFADEDEAMAAAAVSGIGPDADPVAVSPGR
jgi:predicted MFS family arabinose efflux permease